MALIAGMIGSSEYLKKEQDQLKKISLLLFMLLRIILWPISNFHIGI